MNKSTELAKLLGLLVQKHRTDNMDQSELAFRIGVGRGTLSKLDCIEAKIAVVSEMLEDVQTKRKRSIPKPQISNDF